MTDNSELNLDDLSLFGNVDSEVGQSINDNYQVTELLAEGSNNLIYLAKNLNNKKIPELVILKKANVSFLRKIQEIKKFDMLLNSLTNIKHVNILETYEFIFDKSGNFYQVCQYLRNSISLKEFLKGQNKIKKADLIRFVNQICDGLNALHEQNIVHGELKPSNVLIQVDNNNDFTVKLTDALINKIINENNQEVSFITLSKDKFNNPYYTSPEVFQGKTVTKSSDIYSLGCVMYELVTSRPPYSEQNLISNYEKQINEFPENFPIELKASSNFIQRIESITFKCLAKTPNDRYKTVNDLKNDMALAFVASDEVWRSKSQALLQNEITQAKLKTIVSKPKTNFSIKPKPIKLNINLEKIILNFGIAAILSALAFFGYSVVANQDTSYKNLNNNTLFINNQKIPETNNFDSQIEKDKVNLQEVVDECGVDTLQQINALEQLALIYIKAGKLDLAFETYSQIKTISEKLNNLKYKFTALMQLAEIAYLQNHFDVSKNYCLEALEMFKANPNDINLANFYTILANMDLSKNEIKSACDTYQKIYKITMPYRYHEPGIFIMTGFRLADAYRQLKKYNDSEEVFKYCLGFFNNRVHNGNQRIILNAYYSLSLTLISEKKYSEAIQALKICQDIVKKIKLTNDPIISAVNHCYLNCLWHTDFISALMMVLTHKSGQQ